MHSKHDFFCTTICFYLLTLSLTHSLTVEAAQLPSLFRGVTVVDSSIGVRVVSVDETSQAARADIRPDDIIVRIDDHEVHSIDEFAILSKALKGRSQSATVLVFRQGQPMELRLHLFSYPVLATWGLQVIPEFDIRFAEPRVGAEYWQRQARGYEMAHDAQNALHAYLNALHNVPDDTDTAVKVSQLFCQVSQQRLRKGKTREGVSALSQAVILMQKLLDRPLTDEQLHALKQQLKEALATLTSASSPSP